MPLHTRAHEQLNKTEGLIKHKFHKVHQFKYIKMWITYHKKISTILKLVKIFQINDVPISSKTLFGIWNQEAGNQPEHEYRKTAES